jgi:hypothetical protein
VSLRTEALALPGWHTEDECHHDYAAILIVVVAIRMTARFDDRLRSPVVDSRVGRGAAAPGARGAEKECPRRGSGA